MAWLDDELGNVFNVFGSAPQPVQDTVVYKFLSGSLQFPSSGVKAIQAADNPDFDLGSGSFCIDFWVYPDTLPAMAATRTFCGHGRLGGIAESTSSTIFITDDNRISKRLCDDLSFIADLPNDGASVPFGNDRFRTPGNVTSDGTYIYVVDGADIFAPPENNRLVKRLCSDLSYDSQIGTKGSGNDEFYAAFGITNDGTNLYIVDTYNNRVVKRLCSDLSYDSKIGSSGSGNDQFSSPRSIATDGTYIYVLDSWNHRVVKRLCSGLSYDSKIGVWDVSGNDAFNYPQGIATDGTYLYIADTQNNRIHKRLCSNLSYVSIIGSLGSGNDQFSSPRGIATDGTYIYVADTGNERIVKRLCSDLSYDSKIGSAGGAPFGPDNFASPCGIVVSPNMARWEFSIGNGATYPLYFAVYDGSGAEVYTIVSTAGSGLTVSNWQHLALCVEKSGGNLIFRFFKDGTQVGADITEASVPIPDPGGLFCIGTSGPSPSPFNVLKCRIDEFRFSVGTPRWTSDFVVPTAPYSVDANTKILMHYGASAPTTGARMRCEKWFSGGVFQGYYLG